MMSERTINRRIELLFLNNYYYQCGGIDVNMRERASCAVNELISLFNQSLRAETHLGPDGARPEQNAQAMLKSLYKHAGQLVYENVMRETDLKI